MAIENILSNNNVYNQTENIKIFPNGNFIQFHKETNDEYVSVNTFTNHYRFSENAFELMAFYLDLDYKFKKYNEQKINKIIKDFKKHCDYLKIPYPSNIVYSGGGLHIYWQIKPVNQSYIDEEGEFKSLYGANAKYCAKLYLHILKALIKKFVDFNADPSCSDLSRVLRKIGSINSKNNQECIELEHNNTQYYIKDFSHLLEYTQQEVEDFKNQVATIKQFELAKALCIEISNNKFKAQQEIEQELLKRNKNNKPKITPVSAKTENNTYLLKVLTNAFKLGHIKRNKGITNNYCYFLGIALKTNKINITEEVYKLIFKKLKIKPSEEIEIRKTIKSGYNSHNIKIKKETILSKLKLNNDQYEQIIKLKRKKRVSKLYVTKIYNKLKTNPKLMIGKSGYTLAKKYKISKTKMYQIIKKIKEEVQECKTYNPIVIENKPRNIKLEVIYLQTE